MGLLGQAIPIIGGVAITLGWLTKDQVADLTAHVLAIAGPIITIAGLVWAWVANSKKSVSQSIGAMPETKVEAAPGGAAVVTINDPTLAKAALYGQASAKS